MISVLVSTMTFVLLLVAMFQLLLAIGKPLGAYTLGGYYTVLPLPLRFVSALSSVVVLLIIVVYLSHVQWIPIQWLPTTPLLWGIAIFFILNTIANLLSKSTKERRVMTPIAAFLVVGTFSLLIIT
ncbi:hypothetical protein [Geomicrobium sp. JCM 19038]|uniref:hypothetical protein n=1 Tax=Geomicrobium sp. JCM 19038 TaxID=1460635 RepID=UPI00045F28D5|nr:hypothetical protein [Geomicrobium sp. JCM 19038]GAK08244.1 hypothetical protein JCM19038_2019 [Geomicrobium sp. JCM 19038]